MGKELVMDMNGRMSKFLNKSVSMEYCFLMEVLEVVMEQFTEDGIQIQTVILRRLKGQLLKVDIMNLK
jgi:hypothetical protein